MTLTIPPHFLYILVRKNFETADALYYYMLLDMTRKTILSVYRNILMNAINTDGMFPTSVFETPKLNRYV